MIISLLDQHIDRLMDIRYMTVDEMIPGLSDDLQWISEDELAMIAFKRMVEKNISGLAVVDSNHALVDTISVRDLRGMGFEAEKFMRIW